MGVARKDALVARMRFKMDPDSLDSVDIRLVSGERLGRFSASNIPELRSRIARARDKYVLVRPER